MHTPGDIANAYAAGIIDGEGSILLKKSGRWRRPAVTMESTSEELVDYMANAFGGRKYHRSARNNRSRQSWTWVLYGAPVPLFLTAILPYLREPSKTRRARLILFEYPRIADHEDHTIKQAFTLKFLAA